MSSAQGFQSSIFADRRRLIGRVITVTIMMLLFFSWPNWDAGAHELTAVELLLVPVLAMMFWQLQAGAAVEILENVLMICAVVLFSALLVFPSLENTGIYWVAAYPFIAYFLRPVRSAIFWVAGISMLVGLVGVLDALQWFDTPHTPQQIFCLLSVVLFFWFFAHIYQSQLEYRQALLERANHELDEQKGRLQTVLDHAPLAIWMQDADRKIQFVNKTILTWNGFNESDAGRILYFSDLLAPELRKRSEETDWACLNGESGIVTDRETLRMADGEERIFDVIKVRRVSAEGVTLGLVGFSIDATDKVRADEAQKQLERQVEHAQRLESLGVMAGGIAHDFNNLLTAIQGNVELALLEPDLSDAMQENLSGIASASRTATDLCRQMLAYSGRGILKPEYFSLPELVEDMRPLLDASVGKSVQLRFELSNGAHIHGDQGQIRQVLLNMVMNAAEAIDESRSGIIRVTVQSIELDQVTDDPLTGVGMQPGDYVRLTVADNGMGMGVDIQQRMFEPFFTTKFTGRGLGMSAVLGILRAHDAGLEVESVEGTGTTMHVLFPSVAVEAGKPQGLEVSSRAVPLSGQVLVVDDEPEVLKIASRMLQRLGFDVAMADSGETALELFSAKPATFGWVLLDVTMPGMDGVECMRRMRKIRPDIRVVMSSGYNAEMLESPAEEDHPDEFLSKPYTFKILQDVASRYRRPA